MSFCNALHSNHHITPHPQETVKIVKKKGAKESQIRSVLKIFFVAPSKQGTQSE